MKTKRKMRVLALAGALTLALVLSPATALAEPLVGAPIDGAQSQEPKALTTQAKKMKTVYLLTGSYGGITTYFTYNKNGLLTLRRAPHVYCIKYKYKGVNIAKANLDAGRGQKGTTKYVSKNGLPVKYKDNKEYLSNYKPIPTRIYRDKKNRVIRTTGADKATYTYKIKNGRLTMTEKKPSEKPIVMIFDKEGNVIRSGNDSYKLTYENGLLKSSSRFSNGVEYGMTYTYKKVRVPASYAKTVERQQLELRGNSMYGMF